MNRIFSFIGRYLVSMVANIVLAVAGILPRFREASYEAAYRLGWRKRPVVDDGMPPLNIPSAELKSIVSDPQPVHIFEPDAANGNVSEWELLSIAQIVANKKPEACFEIGTFDGRTTLNIAANMPATGKVYTMDLPPDEVENTALAIASGDEDFIKKEESGKRFKNTPYADRITQLWGDSATFDYTPYIGKMDLVFVDGAHSFEYVKKDTDTALSLLKPEGGIILWHDYGSKWWKGLTRAMNELYAEKKVLSGMVYVRGTVLVYCHVQ